MKWTPPDSAPEGVRSGALKLAAAAMMSLEFPLHNLPTVRAIQPRFLS